MKALKVAAGIALFMFPSMFPYILGRLPDEIGVEFTRAVLFIGKFTICYVGVKILAKNLPR